MLAKAFVAVGGAALYGVVWVAYEEFYRGLDLTPDEVGLGQPTIVSRAAVLLGVISLSLVFLVGFALVAYRVSAPVLSARRGSESWLGYWSKVAGANVLALVVAVGLPVGALQVLAKGPSAAILASLIITAGGLALEMGWLLSDPDIAVWERGRRLLRRVYPSGTPRIGGLLVVSVVGVVLVAWASNLLSDAAYAGRRLRSTGVLPANKVMYLNVGVAAARIFPKGVDALNVCEGEPKAVLLRRSDSVAHVLLVRGPPAAQRSEVVRLQHDDYGVVAASDAATACNPGAS